MKTFCIPKDKVDKFKKALLSGGITPEKLEGMFSSDRRAMLEGLLGNAEIAKEINLLIEKKFLLKNKEAGVIKAIQDTLGLNSEQKEALILKAKERLSDKQSRIFEPGGEKKILEEIASDIYSKKYRADISPEEAKNIFDLQKKADELLEKIPKDSPKYSPERMEYGLADVMLKKYVGDLIHKSKQRPLKEYLLPKNYFRVVLNAGGTAKSFLSSMDNSFFGTQGIKRFYENPFSWSKELAMSFSKISKQLIARGKIWGPGDDAVMDTIKAGVYSRDNALNGAYKKAGLDIGIDAEEAFPSSIPEKIPFLGRLFKMSEVGFNGSALEMRANYFDKAYDIANKMGINVESKEELKAIGNVANSMTGRGSLGKLSSLSEEINNLLFSGKFLKSNIDFISAHAFDPKSTPFSRKLARKNLLKFIIGSASIMTLASIINGDETDPRGTGFGKVDRSDDENVKYIDYTGKIASLITLISRTLVPTLHNGEWGLWMKNSQTGEFRKLNERNFGLDTALDTFENFFENKLSPLAGLLRDIWTGERFGGEELTPVNVITGNTTPLFVQDVGEDDLLGNLMSFIGFQSSVFKKNKQKLPKPKNLPKIKKPNIKKPNIK